MIDFKVPRAKDCVLIDTKEWIQNSAYGLTVHRMSGRDIPTYLAKAKSAYLDNQNFKESLNVGDLLLISRVASEVAQYRTFSIDGEDKRYYNVPVMQILGSFKDNKISFNSLNMLFDKVLIRKLDDEKGNILKLPENNTMIGEVVKVGTCRFDKDWNKQELTVKIGDRVLIRDNVTTEIFLDGTTYYATEESMIVGIFKTDNYTLENLDLINESVILDKYIPEKTLSSSIFLTPVMNYEDADITSIYNRDLLRIVAVDKSLTKLSKGDIILADRNVTNYVYLGMNKYLILSGMTYIEAKVTR